MKSFFLRAICAASLCLVAQLLHGQAAISGADDRPLPDIPTLMNEVENHQRVSEAVQKNYLYHEVAIEEGATEVRVGTALFGQRPAPKKKR